MRIKIARKSSLPVVERLALTKNEAAAALGVNTRTLDNWVKRGRIKTVKTERLVLFPMQALQEFVNGADSTDADPTR